MENHDKVISDLKFLTESTLKKICTLDIITPVLYRDAFLEFADKHKIDYDHEDEEYNQFLLERIDEFQKGIVNTTSTLKTSINSAIEAVQEKDEEKLTKVEEDLRKLDIYIKSLEDELLQDQLTKTRNRRWLYGKYLANEKFQQEGTLSFVDLDNFKEINDKYGHVVGDKVLILIAMLLKEIPDTDIVRYAGDEFVILCKETRSEYAAKTVQSISDKLHSKVVHVGKHKFHINFSFGTTGFKKEDVFNEVIAEADSLMYQDKKSSAE